MMSAHKMAICIRSMCYLVAKLLVSYNARGILLKFLMLLLFYEYDDLLGNGVCLTEILDDSKGLAFPYELCVK